MKQKYVIIDETYPVLFGEYYKHSDFSHMGKITSAGFCSIREVETDFKKYPNLCCCQMMEVSCYGESISLGIKSNPEYDQKIIQRMFNS